MNDPIDREVAVFSAARRLAAGERAAYLDETCAGDAALRQRVENLLRASEEAETFLQSPALGAQRSSEALAPADPLPSVTAPGEKAGDRIGRYKLLQQIGEGGCGVVYMAEQEEPVRRRVALKVIKLGMDTKQVVARFEAERQALALMDHPNIAKVLEAGATDTGRPYFVMELVRGIKITHYCDENNLSTEERLDLFIKVSQAVQHAHQKGIIHRDLKPSNILVADHDGVPVPKIIDFGIAKATTDQRLTDKTLFTAFEQFIGTPAYMSPEQARMSGLDIDTRTDIYSLGVLLYELLTGKTPFDTQDLLAAGLDEMRRTISEKEPARPSTRLSTMLAGELTTTAKHRRTDAPKLVHLLRGDLDWIVMKALEKDRARRYDTANGLAMDIQRYLADEAIVARPPSNFYRFQKLARRNKLTFGAIGAVAAALLIGLGVSTWLLVKETQARRRAVAAEKKAQTEAVKSQRVAVFLKKTLQGAGPSKALGRDTTMLREILNETAKSVSQELIDQPEVAIELCLTLADTYHDLGLYKEMEGVARQSLQIARSKLGEENESVAVSLTNLGDALQHLGEMHVGSLEEAEKYSRAGFTMSKKLLGNENPKVAIALQHLANVLSAQRRFAESEPMQREALAMYRKLIGNECPEVAKSLSDLALLLLSQPTNRVAEAETAIREALAIQRKLLGDQHPEVAKSLRIQAIVLMYQQKPAEAEAMFRDSIARWGKLQANDRPELAMLPEALASVLTQQNKLSEAEAKHRDALAMYKKLFGNDHPDVANSLNNLAWILSRQGKLAETETTYREVLAIRRKLSGDQSSEVAYTLQGLASALQQQGRLTDAEATSREALAIFRKLANEYDVTWALANLANVLEEQGNLREAEDLLRDSVAMIKKMAQNAQKEDPYLAVSLDGLARVLLRQGKRPEAEAKRREAAERGNAQVLNSLAWQLSALPDPKHRDGASAVLYAEKAAAATNRKDPNMLDTLAVAYAEAGQFTDAIRVQQEALALQQVEWERKIYLSKLRLYQSNVPYREHGLMADMTSGLITRGKFAEAEPLARECLALRENEIPNDWKTSDSRGMLGASLLGQKKFAEAETELLAAYEGLKQRQDQNLGEAMAHLVKIAERLAQVYELTGQPEQAAEWKKRHALAQAAAQSAPEITARRASGSVHAQHGRFIEAAADFARVIELRPDDHEVWHWQAATLVWTGQLDDYRELRRRSMELFGHTTDPNTADRIAKDFLILPSSGSDLETASKLADLAVNAPTNHPDMTWFRFVKGLSEYRQGHFANAVEWMQRVLSDAGRNLNRDAEACMVLAMAQHQIKLTDEARTNFAKGLEIVNTKMPKLDSGEVGDDSVDWVFAHALMREAKGLIQLPPVAPKK